VLFVLADQPLLLSRDFDAMIERFAAGEVGIVYASYAGQRGSPVLFGSRYREELESLRGEEGGRLIVDRHPGDRSALPLPPERGLDIDSPEDLSALV
jgi:molybdenum cofactor cytidylyltransferase